MKLKNKKIFAKIDFSAVNCYGYIFSQTQENRYYEISNYILLYTETIEYYSQNKKERVL